tara:strand:- start:5962 stop:6450 length:489 start_codon:yes stop_codon:yes gene_type:complete
MKNFIISILILVSLSLKAQDKNKTIWEFIKGEELKSSVTFLPFGSHTSDLDVIDIWYTSYNYKSYEIAAFKNSFGEFTLAALYKRKQQVTEKFSVIYGLGVMYGYHGELRDVESIPFRNTFLFTGEINPVGGVNLDYRVAKKLSLQISLTPVVILYGFRYLL